MDELSDDLHDQPGKVESRYDLGGRPGYELQAPDGERRDGMVWLDFEGLNKVFNIDGPAGAWTERYAEGTTQSGFAGRKHTAETRAKMSQSQKGKTRSGRPRTQPNNYGPKRRRGRPSK